MRKFTAVLAVIALVLSTALLAGCSAGGGTVKTGLGHVIAIEKSKDATSEAAGLAQVDTVMAAVSVDSKGKIVSVTIDTAQTKVNFGADGKLTTDKAGEFKTKVELGDGYGMKKGSGIGKEWYEQIADLEKWMVGKTIEEVKAMKVNDADGKTLTSEADLTSKVTVDVSDYLAAVEEAVKNAK